MILTDCGSEITLGGISFAEKRSKWKTGRALYLHDLYLNEDSRIVNNNLWTFVNEIVKQENNDSIKRMKTYFSKSYV